MPHFNAALSYCKIERWAQVDSNHRPRNYEFPALTTAPWALFKCQVSSIRVSVTLKNLTPDTNSQSGRWDSNPRISAWKADALPLGDSRVRQSFYHNQGNEFLMSETRQENASLSEILPYTFT